MDLAELGIALPHFAEWLVIFLRETHRHFADVEIKNHFICTADPTNHPCRSQGGMAGERQFFIHREDAYPVPFLFCFFKRPRKNESGLRQVCFSCQRLHLFRGESVAIKKDCKLVSFEWVRRKNINQNVRQTRHSFPRGCLMLLPMRALSKKIQLLGSVVTN